MLAQSRLAWIALFAGCSVTRPHFSSHALRASHQLLHGHLAAAFRLNPTLVVSLPLLCWLGARYGLQKARSQPVSLGLRPGWLWLTLAAVLTVSVLRNLPGAPFDLLRP